MIIAQKNKAIESKLSSSERNFYYTLRNSNNYIIILI